MEMKNGTYLGPVGRIRTGFFDWRSSGLVASGEKHWVADWGAGKTASADFSADEAGELAQEQLWCFLQQGSLRAWLP